MKKLITLVLVIVLTVSLCGNLSGCLLIHAINTTLEQREARRNEVLQIQGTGGYAYATEHYYVRNGTGTFYIDIICDSLKDVFPELDSARENTNVGLECKIYKNLVYYILMKSEKDGEESYLFGYIDLSTMAVVYHEIAIPKTWNGKETSIKVEQVGGQYAHLIARYNYEYYQYKTFRRYVLDVSNDVLTVVESFEDYANTYPNDVVTLSDGSEYEIPYGYSHGDDNNVLTCVDKAVVLTYDYVLQRSEELQRIDGIVGNNKQSIRHRIFIVDNKVLLVIESYHSPTIGELIPVVFECDIETDTVIYVGTIGYHDVRWILPSN